MPATFSIRSTSPSRPLDGTLKTVTLTSALPTLTDTHGVDINAYSQNGATANSLSAGNNAVLRIQLSGANAGMTADGFLISGGNSTIRGFIINGFKKAGVRMVTNGNNVVSGNFIGTDAAGTTAIKNTTGVEIDSGNNNTIGGATPAARNVISGNSFGVALSVGGSNRVSNNFIGTTPSGLAALGNAFAGVNISSGSSNIIGGTSAAERNVISGNASDGVQITGSSSSGNMVRGNFIGTDVTGAAVLANQGAGVFISDSPNNTVGGILRQR